LDEDGTDIGDIGQVEITSLPSRSEIPISASSLGVIANVDILSFAIENSKTGRKIIETENFVKTDSNLLFPRLPQWDPVTDKSSNKYGMNVQSLLRPKQTSSEPAKVTKTKKKAKTKSSMDFVQETGPIRIPRVTTADIAGIWK
jgi:hypothetical protein